MAAPVLADAHIHLFRDGFFGPDQPGVGISDELSAYQALRVEHGIARALVIGYEGTPRQAGNNAYLVDLAARYDWVAPVAYLPVWPPPSPDDVADLAASGFVGVACWLLTTEDAERLAAWPLETLYAIGRHLRLVSLNARATVTTRLRAAVAALAPATVMFAHLGLPGKHNSVPDAAHVHDRLAGLFTLAAEQHVGVKASGLYALAERDADVDGIAAAYLGELIEAFGADRMYWGSDFVPVLARSSFDRAVHIQLPVSGAERAGIMGSNLAQLLGPAR